MKLELEAKSGRHLAWDEDFVIHSAKYLIEVREAVRPRYAQHYRDQPALPLQRGGGIYFQRELQGMIELLGLKKKKIQR